MSGDRKQLSLLVKVVLGCVALAAQNDVHLRIFNPLKRVDG